MRRLGKIEPEIKHYQLGVKPIEEIIRKKQLWRLGHLYKMSEDCLPLNTVLKKTAEKKTEEEECKGQGWRRGEMQHSGKDYHGKGKELEN